MIRGDPWKVKVNIRWNWVITCSGWMPLSSFLVANILGYPRFADKSKSAGRTSCLLRTSFQPTHFIEFLTSIYSVVLGSLLAPQTWQNGTHFKAAISQYSSWELGGKRSVRNTDGDGSKPFFTRRTGFCHGFSFNGSRSSTSKVRRKIGTHRP